jgi:ubiquinone/menaquinone biosynthesis C-methylase UbiE
MKVWEKYHEDLSKKNPLDHYLQEIESVREIYEREFHLGGTILDVGSYQGRLRHFFNDDDALYVGIDPTVNFFNHLEAQPNLTKAYPCLLEPFNFVAAQAEYLPFKSKCFDWIHMRSVLDHLFDPFQALVEAYRCCKPEGQFLLGLTIDERRQKLRSELRQQSILTIMTRKFRTARRIGFSGLRNIAMSKLLSHDPHTYHLRYAELIDLLQKTRWKIQKEYWQKPPLNFVVYLGLSKA